MPILVWNSSDKPVYLRSFDEDSVMIGPKAKRVQVAQKFNWSPPAEVKIEDLGPDLVDPCQHVQGTMPLMARRPPKAHNINGEINSKTAAEIRMIAESKQRARDADTMLKSMRPTPSVESSKTEK